MLFRRRFVRCEACGARARIGYWEGEEVVVVDWAALNRRNTAFKCQYCGAVVCFLCLTSGRDVEASRLVLVHASISRRLTVEAEGPDIEVAVCPKCGAEGGPYFFKR